MLEKGEPAGESSHLPGKFFPYVADCDARRRRAVAAGGTSLDKPTDQPYGHCTAVDENPFGSQRVTLPLHWDAKP